MTSEEYREMLKEQYKKELRARKEFQEKVAQLKKQQTLLQAIENLNPDQDDTSDWLEKLNQETALMEAKTELALNLAEEQKKQLESLEHQAELEKLAAQQLILEMKKQMGLIPADEPPLTEDKSKTESPAEEKPQSETPDSPDNANILGDF